MPFHGCRFPVKRCGNLIGNMTASLSASFAWSRPATSSHRILGFSERMAPASAPRSFLESASCSSSSPSPLLSSQYDHKRFHLQVCTYCPFPLPPAALPFAPIAPGFFRFAASFWFRWDLSFSARSMYSETLPRIISLVFRFFSPSLC